MADGETHFKYLKMGWFIIVPLGFIVTIIAILRKVDYWYLYQPFLYFNYYLCRYFDPDDDQKSLTLSEGRILSETRRYYLGFIGAVLVSYSFIYAYVAGLFGGHRSWFSHGIGLKGFEVISTGTWGRLAFYNIPPYMLLNVVYSFAITNWGWTTSVGVGKSFYMNIWFVPYIITQAIAWFIGDTIHLILDTEWAKGRLYNKK